MKKPTQKNGGPVERENKVCFGVYWCIQETHERTHTENILADEKAF